MAQILVPLSSNNSSSLRRTNSLSVIQVPYFDDISVNDVHATLEGLISKVEIRPKVTPISYKKVSSSDMARQSGRYTHGFVQS